MSDFAYTGYMARLKAKRAERKALREAMPVKQTIHQRVEAWFSGLSDADKSRTWTMRELRAVFNETPQRIGAALFDLGWTRKRMWRDDRPTARYWLKR